MATKCYALVRGSGLRVTDLTTRGYITDKVRYAASKSIIKVEINEVTESGSNEVVRSDVGDDPRLHFVESDRTIRYTTDITFLRCDPGALALISPASVVTDANGNVVGFDVAAKGQAVAKSFALEVWSSLPGQKNCAPGTREWGYTLFPYLRGGRVSGVSIENGLVSFTVKAAQTRKGVRWRVGPYDISGTWQRLLAPITAKTTWRSMITTLQPPAQTDGTVAFDDVVYGGNAVSTSADVINGGNATTTSPWIISGGGAES